MTNEYNIKTIVALLYKTNDNIVHSLGCSTWEIDHHHVNNSHNISGIIIEFGIHYGQILNAQKNL